MAAPMVRGANVALTREIPSLRSVVLGISLAPADSVLADNLVVATILCDAGGGRCRTSTSCSSTS